MKYNVQILVSIMMIMFALGVRVLTERFGKWKKVNDMSIVNDLHTLTHHTLAVKDVLHSLHDKCAPVASKIDTLTSSIVTVNTNVKEAIGEIAKQTPRKKVTYLYQKDFANKTYVIDKPGIYRLAENIVHNSLGGKNKWGERHRPLFLDGPNKGQINPKYIGGADVPSQQQAILVQCDHVEIDLCGYSLVQGKEMYIEQRVYTLIELAKKFFENNDDFDPEPQKPVGRTPSNVLIHNGCLGATSHFAIHGTDNMHVTIKNLTIKEFDVSAIWMNNPIECNVSNCSITGLQKNTQAIVEMAAYRTIGTGMKGIVDSNMWGINFADRFGAAVERQSNISADKFLQGFNDGQSAGENNSQRTGPRSCSVKNTKISNLENRIFPVNIQKRTDKSGNSVYILGSALNGGHTALTVGLSDVLEAVFDKNAKYAHPELQYAMTIYKIKESEEDDVFKYVRIKTGEITTDEGKPLDDLNVEASIVIDRGELLRYDVEANEKNELVYKNTRAVLESVEMDTFFKLTSMCVETKDKCGKYPILNADTFLTQVKGKIVPGTTKEEIDTSEAEADVIGDFEIVKNSRILVSDLLGINSYEWDPNPNPKDNIDVQVKNFMKTEDDSWILANGRGERFPGDVVRVVTKQLGDDRWAVAKVIDYEETKHDAVGHILSGLIAIELSRARASVFEDIEISNINVMAADGYSTHPWAVFTHDSFSNVYKRINISNIIGPANSSRIFHLDEASRSNLIEDCHIRHAVSPAGNKGFLVESNSHSNVFRNCSVQRLLSGVNGGRRGAGQIGFDIHGPGNIIEHCKVIGLDTIGDVNDAETMPNIGFLANDPNNIFRNCEAVNISSKGENTSHGFKIDKENTILENCTITNVKSEKSKAFGIEVTKDAVGVLVENCTVTNVKSEENEAFGIIFHTNVTQHKDRNNTITFSGNH